MTVNIITDHVEQAIKRLIQQYKEKPFVEGVVEVFTDEKQELEDVIHAMYFNRFVDNAEGQQLDNFGKIVDQARQGFDDAFYQILLKFKIGANVSKGDPERVISSIRLITGATLAHYQNLGNANIGLSVNTSIDPDLVNFIFVNMGKVLMAGVRLNFLACFDPDESFSLDGIGPVGLGLSSLAAPDTGGKLAFLHRPTEPAFALAGDDSALGLGTIQDPLAGGLMVGL